MSSITDQTILDDALNLAKKVLNAVLFEDKNLETNLYGFLAISHRLGREKDISWVKGELQGFFTIDPPLYRKKVASFIYQGRTRLTTKDNSSYFHIPLKSGLPKLEHAVKEDDGKMVEFSIERNDPQFTTIEKLSKHKITSTFVNVKYFKADITKISGYVKVELIEKLDSMIQEITYGKIPKSIFSEYQTKVNQKLSDSNPNAISALNTAYDSLGGSHDPERISQVSLACRRLIKHIADEVFPSSNEQYILKLDDKTYNLSLGDDKVLNRLTAYVDSLNYKNKQHILDEINVLRGFYYGEEGYVNKGIHSEITNSEAKRLVLYTYLILGDIILLESDST